MLDAYAVSGSWGQSVLVSARAILSYHLNLGIEDSKSLSTVMPAENTTVFMNLSALKTWLKRIPTSSTDTVLDSGGEPQKRYRFHLPDGFDCGPEAPSNPLVIIEWRTCLPGHSSNLSSLTRLSVRKGNVRCGLTSTVGICQILLQGYFGRQSRLTTTLASSRALW